MSSEKSSAPLWNKIGSQCKISLETLADAALLIEECQNDNKWKKPVSSENQRHNGLAKGCEQVERRRLGIHSFGFNLWDEVTDEQKKEIVERYGPEGPIPKQITLGSGPQEIGQLFQLYNPRFFLFFYYEVKVGLWLPVLGEEAELKRRANFLKYQQKVYRCVKTARRVKRKVQAKGSLQLVERRPAATSFCIE